MKFTNIEKYHFKSDNVIGFLSDLSHFNSEIDQIKLHEETIVKNEIQAGVDVINFEPIVLSLYPDIILDDVSESFETEKLILLDGHHRWKYANRQNLIDKLKCILVNFKDVKIESYLFNINLDTDKFLNFLHDEGYSNSNQGTIGISFSNEMYVNNNISNISELYNFKKTLQDNEIITPILDNKEDSSKLIKFTPLNPNDLLNVNHLLPPKSTWITPRI